MSQGLAAWIFAVIRVVGQKGIDCLTPAFCLGFLVVLAFIVLTLFILVLISVSEILALNMTKGDSATVNLASPRDLRMGSR